MFFEGWGKSDSWVILKKSRVKALVEFKHCEERILKLTLSTLQGRFRWRNWTHQREDMRKMSKAIFNIFRLLGNQIDGRNHKDFKASGLQRGSNVTGAGICSHGASLSPFPSHRVTCRTLSKEKKSLDKSVQQACKVEQTKATQSRALGLKEPQERACISSLAALSQHVVVVEVVVVILKLWQVILCCRSSAKS